MKIIDTTAFSLTLAVTLAVCIIGGSVAAEEKKRNLFLNKSLKKHGKRGAPSGSLEFGYGLPARLQNNQPPIYGPPEPAPVYENHHFAAPSTPVYNQPAVLENPGHQIPANFHPVPVQIPQPIGHPPPYPVGFPAAVQVPHPVQAAPVSQPAVYPVGIPVVQTVTKHVGVPVPVPVHVAVPVPRPYPVQVEKIVHVEKPVHYPVHVDRPVAVPVHVPVPVPVSVPRPYPVERYVHVDRPYPVHIAVPVHVPKPYPVPVAIHKTQWKPATTKYGW